MVLQILAKCESITINIETFPSLQLEHHTMTVALHRLKYRNQWQI